jgi:hypothetical protein
MSLIRINKRNPSLQIKNIKPKLINVIDSNKILFDKNEALKSFELDDDFHDSFFDEEEFTKLDSENSNDEETGINNIILVSDCNDDNLILEKNIRKLEKHLQNLIQKGELL